MEQQSFAIFAEDEMSNSKYKFTLLVQNTLMETSHTRDFYTPEELAEAAFWTLQNTTHLAKSAATLLAEALKVPGAIVTYPPVTLRAYKGLR